MLVKRSQFVFNLFCLSFALFERHQCEISPAEETVIQGENVTSSLHEDETLQRQNVGNYFPSFKLNNVEYAGKKQVLYENNIPSIRKWKNRRLNGRKGKGMRGRWRNQHRRKGHRNRNKGKGRKWPQRPRKWRAQKWRERMRGKKGRRKWRGGKNFNKNWNTEDDSKDQDKEIATMEEEQREEEEDGEEDDQGYEDEEEEEEDDVDQEDNEEGGEGHDDKADVEDKDHDQTHEKQVEDCKDSDADCGGSHSAKPSPKVDCENIDGGMLGPTPSIIPGCNQPTPIRSTRRPITVYPNNWRTKRPTHNVWPYGPSTTQKPAITLPRVCPCATQPAHGPPCPTLNCVPYTIVSRLNAIIPNKDISRQQEKASK